MLKRIAPRCDRKYTFYDNNCEFTLQPRFVDSTHCIVFKNLSTGNNVPYTYNEFADMYENRLVREMSIRPTFFPALSGKKLNKFYAVARGRIDFFITDRKDYYSNAIANFDGVCHGEFDNFFDAFDFIQETDARLPESPRLIETSLTDSEKSLILRYRKLTKFGKKRVREFMDEEF